MKNKYFFYASLLLNIIPLNIISKTYIVSRSTHSVDLGTIEDNEFEVQSSITFPLKYPIAIGKTPTKYFLFTAKDTVVQAHEIDNNAITPLGSSVNVGRKVTHMAAATEGDKAILFVATQSRLLRSPQVMTYEVHNDGTILQKGDPLALETQVNSLTASNSNGTIRLIIAPPNKITNNNAIQLYTIGPDGTLNLTRKIAEIRNKVIAKNGLVLATIDEKPLLFISSYLPDTNLPTALAFEAVPKSSFAIEMYHVDQDGKLSVPSRRNQIVVHDVTEVGTAVNAAKKQLYIASSKLPLSTTLSSSCDIQQYSISQTQGITQEYDKRFRVPNCWFTAIER